MFLFQREAPRSSTVALVLFLLTQTLIGSLVLLYGLRHMLGKIKDTIIDKRKY